MSVLLTMEGIRTFACAGIAKPSHGEFLGANPRPIQSRLFFFSSSSRTCLPLRTAFGFEYGHIGGGKGNRGARAMAGSSGGNAEDSIKTKINANPVVVYSKSWCPYCQEVKGLFQGLGVKPLVIELDELGPAERQLQDALFRLTGQSTVPNVFIGGKHIGGCSDTMELHQKGELISLLSGAGINVS